MYTYVYIYIYTHTCIMSTYLCMYIYIYIYNTNNNHNNNNSSSSSNNTTNDNDNDNDASLESRLTQQTTRAADAYVCMFSCVFSEQRAASQCIVRGWGEAICIYVCVYM